MFQLNYKFLWLSWWEKTRGTAQRDKHTGHRRTDIQTGCNV